MEYTIINPADQSAYATIRLNSKEDADVTVSKAAAAQKKWKALSLDERKKYVSSFVEHFVAEKDEIAKELSSMIGRLAFIRFKSRPFQQNYNEIKGFEFRARHLLSIAEKSLADVEVENSEDFVRFMSREPLGVVFIIAAWNYPYLVSVNGVIPSLLAGNTVILK
jgi:acyl-CoA reductase-like NAD-dependent aldehyde dehydrogenase